MSDIRQSKKIKDKIGDICLFDNCLSNTYLLFLALLAESQFGGMALHMIIDTCLPRRIYNYENPLLYILIKI